MTDQEAFEEWFREEYGGEWSNPQFYCSGAQSIAWKAALAWSQGKGGTAANLRCVISDLCGQVRERDADIERLRAELDCAAGKLGIAMADAAFARAELDALREQKPVAFDAWVGDEPYHVFRTEASAQNYIEGLSEHHKGARVVPLYAAPVAPSVPEGWQLVPKEPTRQMLDAGHCDLTLDHGFDPMLKYAWSQMCDAAPKPGDRDGQG